MILFDEIIWRDPFTGKKMVPIITYRDPYGKPYSGALRIEGTDTGYPIVNGILRARPELAQRYHKWLELVDLKPPGTAAEQETDTVSSYGFQWTWDSSARTDKDLVWRAAGRFNINPEHFRGKLILDAGCGAGDQSCFFLEHGGRLVSVDLSEAINVAYTKMQANENWVGIQGDISALPIDDSTFDFVYCEGVIQHTKDSAKTVQELARVLQKGGEVAATHFYTPTKWYQKLRLKMIQKRRERLSRLDPYHLLAYTGMLAIISEIPIVGFFLKKSGIVSHNRRMPGLKTTWCCSYDTFSNHAYQRYIMPEAFKEYWDNVGNFEDKLGPVAGALVYLKKL